MDEEGVSMYQRRSVISVLLLSFITCGIYTLFWFYYTARDIQAFLGEDGSPGLEVLFMILCAPYAIYWYYKYSKKIADAYGRSDLPIRDDAVLNVILGIFGLGIVSMCIIQSSLNDLWDHTR